MEKRIASEEELYELAKSKVRKIRDFYINLTCYCIVIPGLIFINLYYTPEIYWFIFSALGWGIGLLFHGLAAFGSTPFLGPEWEAKKIKELMDDRNFK